MAGGMLLPAGQLPLAGRQGNPRRPAFQADDLRSSRSQVSSSSSLALEQQLACRRRYQYSGPTGWF